MHSLGSIAVDGKYLREILVVVNLFTAPVLGELALFVRVGTLVVVGVLIC